MEAGETGGRAGRQAGAVVEWVDGGRGGRGRGETDGWTGGRAGGTRAIVLRSQLK